MLPSKNHSITIPKIYLRFTILAEAEKRQVIHCLLSKSGTK